MIGLLAGFPLMIMAYIMWEWSQGERAAFPPRLMSNRLILVNSIYAFLFAGSYFIIVYYLPYYFQSIQNVSPTISGVRNLPLIISTSLAIIVSGGSTTKTGHTAPLMVVGGVLATIGSGLLYSLDIGTSTGKWIGYQIVGGVGWGLAYQVPINAVHGAVGPSDIATVTAVIVCEYFRLQNIHYSIEFVLLNLLTHLIPQSSKLLGERFSWLQHKLGSSTKLSSKLPQPHRTSTQP